jgi:hypothetical protein
MICLFCISILAVTNSLQAQNEQSGGHVFFFFGDRQYNQLENLYSMQVWAYVPPGHRWQIGNSLINIEYNRSALRPVRTVWDVWPELRNKGYIVAQADYGTASSLSLVIISGNYAVIEEGEAVRLGTLVWEVLDGSQQDGFFMRSDSTHPIVSVIMDSTFELKPSRLDFNSRWTWRSLYPRVIDPATVACLPMYFRAPICEEVMEETTPTPLQDSSMYWHRTPTPTGAGPHVVSYQTDWSLAPIGTERVLHFLSQSLDSILALVQCRWQKQLAPGNLEWRKLANKTDGGIIRWSQDKNEFDVEFGANFIALTLSALHPNDLTSIVAAAACGDGGVRFGMSTILLNDSPDFYVANPHFRWTTDYHTCGYSPRCLDIETILLHEIGHYVGLSHQEQPLAILWGGYDSRRTEIQQCDADNIRRLYSPQLLSQTPVPPPDNSVCGGTTSIAEQPATDIIVDTDLYIYPMPITDGHFSIRTRIDMPTRLTFSILNVMGQTLQVLSDTYQIPGEHSYSFNINLIPGVYFLKAETDTQNRIEKIVVVR